jgi:tetratricopeptide (TPR) repeat protein
MGLLPAYEGFTKAKSFLDKALELNPDLPQSQLNLSWISCWQHWDLAKAFEHAQNTLKIQPSDEIYLTISNFLTVEGKLDTAHNYIDKSLTLIQRDFDNYLPLILLLNTEPIVKPLHNDEHFKKMMIEAIKDDINYTLE